MYAKASPLRGSQIKDLLSDSGLRPSLARKFPPKTWSHVFASLSLAQLRASLTAHPASAEAATTWQPARARGRRWWAINDGGCTRRLAPREQKRQIGYSHRVGLANQRFAQLRSPAMPSIRLRAGSQVLTLFELAQLRPPLRGSPQSPPAPQIKKRDSLRPCPPFGDFR